jgi:collagenase NC10/endostatin
MRTAIVLVATLASCGFCSSANAQQADMTFFITSAGPGKGGDLGGIAGADAHCQSLAQAAGAGNKTWRAYLSTNARGGANAVQARDRIGNGPWQNAKGAVIANSVADLHSENNKINKANALDEKGQPIKVRGDAPNMHDILTGSDKDGHAFPTNMDLTCGNWTSSGFGVAMLGHADREGNPPVAGSQNVAAYMETARSWNAAHTSRGCSQPDLIATGGNGLFYCFAVR